MFDSSKLYYLASPYSHPDPAVRQERYDRVNELAAKLMQEHQLKLIEPIVCGHAKVSLLPSTFAFWQDSCKRFIERSDGLIVYCLPGWETSVGVQAEIQYAAELGLPVYYLDA